MLNGEVIWQASDITLSKELHGYALPFSISFPHAQSLFLAFSHPLLNSNVNLSHCRCNFHCFYRSSCTQCVVVVVIVGGFLLNRHFVRKLCVWQSETECFWTGACECGWDSKLCVKEVMKKDSFVCLLKRPNRTNENLTLNWIDLSKLEADRLQTYFLRKDQS